MGSHCVVQSGLGLEHGVPTTYNERGERRAWGVAGTGGSESDWGGGMDTCGFLASFNPGTKFFISKM